MPTVIGPTPAEQLRALCACVDLLFSSTLRGGQLDKDRELGQFMEHPRPGDLVMEMSTIWTVSRDEVRFGRLVKIAQEELQISDETRREWAALGEPVPVETVWYVALPDGREYRWVNARFFRVPETTGAVCK